MQLNTREQRCSCTYRSMWLECAVTSGIRFYEHKTDEYCLKTERGTLYGTSNIISKRIPVGFVRFLCYDIHFELQFAR